VNVVTNPGFESGLIAPSTAGVHTLHTVGNSNPGKYMINGLSQNFNVGMIAGITPHSGSQMLMIDNVMASNAVAWEQTVTVSAGKTYYFSAWLTSLSAVEKSEMLFQVQPVTPAGPAVNISATFIPPNGPTWQQYFGTWASGTTTSVTIRLINTNPDAIGGSGNDYAIDDILFRPTCTGTGAGPIPNFGTTSIGLCNMGGSANLNSNVANHANHTYTWYKDGVLVPNATTPNILESQTTTGVYRVCLDSSGCVNTTTVTVTNPLVLDLGPDLDLCNPAFKLLDTRITAPASFNIKWYKNNVLIPDQIYPTYMATGAGTYRVDVTNGATCNGSDEIIITSQAETTVGDFICPEEGDVNATVSVVNAGGAPYEWYDQATNGTLLGTGLTYSATGLTGPTIFYVKSNKNVISGGGLPNSGSAFLSGSSNTPNNMHGQNFMNFTALKAGQLSSVTVRLQFSGNGAGNVTITLEDRTTPGTITAPFAINHVLGAGVFDYVIPVNMSLTLNHNYFFSITGSGVSSTLRYADGNIPTYFPTSYDAATFHSGQAPSIYPGLFDWKFSSGSTCARTPASVISDCPLPVEWLSFDGVLKGGKVMLNWSTASEINNSYFEIQRSEDGINFVSIGKVDGKGNADINSHYTYIDNAPISGVSYYRIVQHDLDGTVSYTNTVAIQTDQKTYLISPNPFKDYFTVHAPEATTIVVTDVLGRVLLHDTMMSNEYSFGENLISGAYIISLINDNYVEHKVVIKE
jgi:hypothetical protein